MRVELCAYCCTIKSEFKKTREFLSFFFFFKQRKIYQFVSIDFTQRMGPVYDVEDILDHKKGANGKLYYLVKWKVRICSICLFI